MAKVERTDEIQGRIIHTYDGIEEADNDLPGWWLWTLCLTIAFSVGYWFYYHEFQVGKLPMEAYAAGLASQAEAGGDVSEAYLDALSKDPTAVAAGEVYAANCVPCHEPAGQGKIGPNLTDEFWIHGGSATDIHRVISEGVLSAGMPNWSGPLGPKAVQKVTAYVLTLRNTNVEGKEPQGERWDPNAADSEGAAASANAAGGGGVPSVDAGAIAPGNVKLDGGADPVPSSRAAGAP